MSKFFRRIVIDGMSRVWDDDKPCVRKRTRHLFNPRLRHERVFASAHDERWGADSRQFLFDTVGEGVTQGLERTTEAGDEEVFVERERHEGERFVQCVERKAYELRAYRSRLTVNGWRDEHKGAREFRAAHGEFDEYLAAKGIAEENRAPEFVSFEPYSERAREFRQVESLRRFVASAKAGEIRRIHTRVRRKTFERRHHVAV